MEFVLCRDVGSANFFRFQVFEPISIPAQLNWRRVHAKSLSGVPWLSTRRKTSCVLFSIVPCLVLPCLAFPCLTCTRPYSEVEFSSPLPPYFLKLRLGSVVCLTHDRSKQRTSHPLPRCRKQWTACSYIALISHTSKLLIRIILWECNRPRGTVIRCAAGHRAKGRDERSNLMEKAWGSLWSIDIYRHNTLSP